jgi:hypothetical protein
MRYFREFIDLRFPTVLTTREQYFITVSRRRMIIAAVIGLCLGVIL